MKRGVARSDPPPQQKSRRVVPGSLLPGSPPDLLIFLDDHLHQILPLWVAKMDSKRDSKSSQGFYALKQTSKGCTTKTKLWKTTNNLFLHSFSLIIADLRDQTATDSEKKNPKWKSPKVVVSRGLCFTHKLSKGFPLKPWFRAGVGFYRIRSQFGRKWNGSKCASWRVAHTMMSENTTWIPALSTPQHMTSWVKGECSGENPKII